MAKIFIGVPTYENIYPDTFKSIYELEKGGHGFIFDYSRGYDVATARNNLVTWAQHADADYLFFVDNDMVLKPDTVVKFFETASKGFDVLLGYYANRGNNATLPGRTCICKLYDENGGLYFNYPTESEYTVKEIDEIRKSGQPAVQVHGGGFGCAFVSMQVFNELPYPWFNWVHYADEQHGLLSEDLYFCEACKNHNIPVFMEPRICAGHIMREVKWADERSK